MSYLGVIAAPGKRSLSPVFQQAALDALRLPHRYEFWGTPPDGLETRVQGLRAPSVLGANVTIPHKVAIIPLLDEVDPLVRKVGAVNTILNREGRLFGCNTDVEGFLRALREDAAFEAGGKRAVIAGAGGSARAVGVALLDAGAAAVTVIARKFERADRLVVDLSPHAGETSLHALPDAYASWAAALTGADVLINCTPAGSPEAGSQSAVPDDLLYSGLLVCDLVYIPEETPLVAAARAAGARVLGGLPMLIYQGTASFKLWTGQDPPLDVMFAAARKALAEQPDGPSGEVKT